MADQQQPDLKGEQEREQQAASSGIEVRTAVLEIDADDNTLEVGEPGDAQDDDDEAVEDTDEATVDADV
jgi:hypothetical protein